MAAVRRISPIVRTIKLNRVLVTYLILLFLFIIVECARGAL